MTSLRTRQYLAPGRETVMNKTKTETIGMRVLPENRLPAALVVIILAPWISKKRQRLGAKTGL